MCPRSSEDAKETTETRARERLRKKIKWTSPVREFVHVFSNTRIHDHEDPWILEPIQECSGRYGPRGTTNAVAHSLHWLFIRRPNRLGSFIQINLQSTLNYHDHEPLPAKLLFCFDDTYNWCATSRFIG